MCSNGAAWQVEERPDGDGSSDKVWWVVAPRTLQVAREYFNCSALQGARAVLDSSMPLCAEY